MSVAIDTNILFDILLPDPEYKNSSLRLLKKYSALDKLIISDIVYGELALHFDDIEKLNLFLSDTNIHLVSISREGLWLASQAWKDYLIKRDRKIQCTQCGNKEISKCSKCGTLITFKQHILSDFLISGHALVESGKLLTRDRGFYRNYFHQLEVINNI